MEINDSLTDEEAAIFIDTFVNYRIEEKSVDFLMSTFAMGPIVLFGLFGNSCIFFTLANVRTLFRTCSYYRVIAISDLFLFIFLLIYILRTWLPFRDYYATTFFEAYILYNVLDVCQFISLCSATVLCFKLCYGILQSRKLKRSSTTAKTTRVVFSVILLAACFYSTCRIFEKQIVEIEWKLSCNNSKLNCSTLDLDRYEIRDYKAASFLTSFVRFCTVLPQFFLLASTLTLGGLLVIWMCLMNFGNSFKSSNNRAIKSSKAWRTQRRVCRLFLLLSFCYTISLIPYPLGQILLVRDEVHNRSSTNETAPAEHNMCTGPFEFIEMYIDCLKRRRNMFLFHGIMNAVQNVGHALPFYAYLLFCIPFRKQFVLACIRLKVWLLRTKFVSNSCYSLKSTMIADGNGNGVPPRNIYRELNRGFRNANVQMQHVTDRIPAVANIRKWTPPAREIHAMTPLVILRHNAEYV